MWKYLMIVFVGFSTFLLDAIAMAETGAEGATADGSGAIIGLAAGLCIAIAAFGGALGQSRAAMAALEGIARNPGAAGKVQTPMIIGLALIESLVIYAFVIAFLLLGKI
jgi:F-type H+-transporting ATPase subunit c